jgi:hypothetical protein
MKDYAEMTFEITEKTVMTAADKVLNVMDYRIA